MQGAKSPEILVSTGFPLAALASAVMFYTTHSVHVSAYHSIDVLDLHRRLVSHEVTVVKDIYARYPPSAPSHPWHISKYHQIQQASTFWFLEQREFEGKHLRVNDSSRPRSCSLPRPHWGTYVSTNKQESRVFNHVRPLLVALDVLALNECIDTLREVLIITRRLQNDLLLDTPVLHLRHHLRLQLRVTPPLQTHIPHGDRLVLLHGAHNACLVRFGVLYHGVCLMLGFLVVAQLCVTHFLRTNSL